MCVDPMIYCVVHVYIYICIDTYINIFYSYPMMFVYIYIIYIYIYTHRSMSTIGAELPWQISGCCRSLRSVISYS